ncbi:MAG: cyclic nucleotide-binding domain-containing protein [Devosia sp.]
MPSLLSLTADQPLRALQPTEAVVHEGEAGGALYVLETGRLTVEREGVAIATIVEPGALIGEMSVLLGRPYTATVRAEVGSSIRVIDNAMTFLEHNPLVALFIATAVCERLDRTSALLVQMRHEAGGNSREQGLFGRLLASLSGPQMPAGGWQAHE